MKLGGFLLYGQKAALYFLSGTCSFLLLTKWTKSWVRFKAGDNFSQSRSMGLNRRNGLSDFRLKEGRFKNSKTKQVNRPIDDFRLRNDHETQSQWGGSPDMYYEQNYLNLGKTEHGNHEYIWITSKRSFCLLFSFRFTSRTHSQRPRMGKFVF